MNAETRRALAEYKAEVDAKYAAIKGQTLEEAIEKQRIDRDVPVPGSRAHWLLINPQGGIDGILIRRYSRSATEAFEDFYPKKRERMKAAAEGWHIEQDDDAGTRFDAWRAEIGKGGEIKIDDLVSPCMHHDAAGGA